MSQNSSRITKLKAAILPLYAVTSSYRLNDVSIIRKLIKNAHSNFARFNLQRGDNQWLGQDRCMIFFATSLVGAYPILYFHTGVVYYYVRNSFTSGHV